MFGSSGAPAPGRYEYWAAARIQLDPDKRNVAKQWRDPGRLEHKGVVRRQGRVRTLLRDCDRPPLPDVGRDPDNCFLRERSSERPFAATPELQLDPGAWNHAKGRVRRIGVDVCKVGNDRLVS
jgi:hypothetical protein